MTAARATGLLFGVLADAAFGERKRGRAAAGGERVAAVVEARLRADNHLAGLFYAGGLTGGAVAIGAVLERLGRRSNARQVATTALGTWLVLGGAGLAVDGTTLARNLESGDLAATRDALSELNPRSTEDLDAIELSGASVETVATHLADNVVAPLMWGALAGVPGLTGVSCVSLLRRGLDRNRHRSAAFRRFPVFLADLTQLLPARAAAGLTVAASPVVGGSAAESWRCWRRDTLVRPSPNAGQVEAAFAGALRIRLGGAAVYPRGRVEHPVVGNGRNPDAGHVTRAVELSRVVGWLAGASAAAVGLVTAVLRRR